MRSENITVRFEHGLHMRVAAQIAKIAQRFNAAVHIRKEGRPQANAGSILEIMSLGATAGEHLSVSADGPEKDEAVRAVTGLFDQGGGI
ncbi:MAG TPA: HPr family phosphocarrier protein [Kiritimatiellia bacterium]|nr:HPr family phosphocarrier protein [Kiritimatiellia bacterium]